MNWFKLRKKNENESDEIASQAQMLKKRASKDLIAKYLIVFGGNSIIPDVSVFRWSRIPITSAGKIANRFETYPDWSIEILSPRQSSTKVLENLLHCSKYGTELGWLIYPEEESILGVFPEQKVQLFRGDQQLPILTEIDLQLTVEQIFNWLKFS